MPRGVAVSVEAARILRRQETPAEEQLWQLLRDRRLHGFKFRRQHSWHRFVLDFYCAEASLVIELDGATHLPVDQCSRDEERTRLLEARGLHVLRFWNHEVTEDPASVLARIAVRLPATRTPAPRPEPI